MKKSIITLVALLLIVCCMFTACDKKEEPVYNKQLLSVKSSEDVCGFESTTAVNGWAMSYVTASANTPVIYYGNETTEPGYLTVARLVNSTADYTYIAQSVAVEKKAVYKISVDAKLISLSGNAEGTGASVILAESGEKLITVTNADGKWHNYTGYFTAKKLDTVKLLLSLGEASSTCKGEVRYDNVSIVRVESAPEGAAVATVRPAKEKTNNNSLEGWLFVGLLGVASIVLLIAAYVLIRRLLAKEAELKDNKAFFNSPSITIALILIIGFVIRLIMAMFAFRTNPDTQFSVDNIVGLAQIKLAAFYSAEGITHLAPGGMYVQWLLGEIANLLKITSAEGVAILAKGPAIFADIITVFLLYYIGRRYTNDKVAAVVALLYAILPVTFIVASLDGWMISVLVMLFMLTFISILDKNYIGMFVSYFLAIFLSELALLALPFVLLFAVYMFIKDTTVKTRVTLIVGVVGSFVLLYLLSLPLTINYVKDGQPFYVLKEYYQLAFGSQVCVDNNFGLYSIFGLNEKAVNKSSNVLNLLFVAVLIAYSVLLYFKNRNRAELILLASMFIVGVSVFCLNRNHESMFLGLALMLLYVLIAGEKRVYKLFAVLSTISFLNVACYVNNTGALSAVSTVFDFAAKNWVIITGGCLATVFAVWLGYIVYNITVDGVRKDVEPLHQNVWPAFKDYCKYLSGRDPNAL